MQVGGTRIVILGTGGTISGLSGSAGGNVNYRAGQVGAGQLLQSAGVGGSVEVEQVAQVDSKDMDAAVWHALAARCRWWIAQADVAGIVVTHGTDTLEETAFFLHSAVAASRPVVLTGAMRPANAFAPDGPQNLRDALVVARTPGARGVMALFAGVLHGAREVRKVHPYRLDAFDSGEAGPLGWVEEGVVRLQRDWPMPSTATADLPPPDQWPRVEIVMNYAGASGAVVEALLAQGVQGLVVAGTGNGSLHHALEAALLKAQAAGVPVLRSTRCLNGRVLPKPGDSIPDSKGLTPVKARVVLILRLLGADQA